ncbi:hypothetical protein CS022_21080 [Veronia nyctiphanis]|uniref:DUF1904 domain-containing protein n=1 Tax=Veronia nyctiphanis TaxID=1278244 RepID=A0A4V1LSF0_9GAMM|nr:DUF1904 family protein [Veronia nyctiphanis]RXJ71468.1 hypothetical protein CS022_21080 [Veronia nyctiphanis]
MPHFRSRAIDSARVAELSDSLLEPLKPLMECSEEDFTFEHISASFYFKGKAGNDCPFVEVLWFDRGQDTQDSVAQIITEHVRTCLNNKEQDVAVIFSALVPSQYYDNGSHYG